MSLVVEKPQTRRLTVIYPYPRPIRTRSRRGLLSKVTNVAWSSPTRFHLVLTNPFRGNVQRCRFGPPLEDVEGTLFADRIEASVAALPIIFGLGDTVTVYRGR
jgi:hypothetical protein